MIFLPYKLDVSSCNVSVLTFLVCLVCLLTLGAKSPARPLPFACLATDDLPKVAKLIHHVPTQASPPGLRWEELATLFRYGE